MAVKFRALRRDPLLFDKSAQMSFQFRAVMRGHASANSDGQMVAAGKRPDVAFEMRKEFHDDGVGRLRNEVALRHFQFIALQRTRFRRDVR